MTPHSSRASTTIFNNDFKNELGLGAGKDLNYVETYQGKLIDAKGAKGPLSFVFTATETPPTN